MQDEDGMSYDLPLENQLPAQAKNLGAERVRNEERGTRGEAQALG